MVPIHQIQILDRLYHLRVEKIQIQLFVDLQLPEVRVHLEVKQILEPVAV